MDQNTEILLNKLEFTDLYVRLDAEGVPSRYRPDITRVAPERYREGNFQVPESYDDHMAEVRRLVNRVESIEGTIEYQGMRMRFVKIVGEGETWASLRAVPLDVPEFSKIGLHPEFTRMMRSLAKKKGLIIVGGSTGDGKTTTCVSLLIHYLKQHGGLLFTLEDPPEWAIHGTVAENAFCLQHKIEDNEDWNQAAKSAMRSRPDYILFGEIRTPEAAENLIKTLTSGHLVVATIHAGQVSDTIAALMQLAEHKLGKVARENLADRLLAAIHQTLTSDGPRIECVVPVTKSDSERQQLIDTIKGGTYTNISKAVKVFEPARKVAREMKRA